MAKFNEGDKVAWDHTLGALHASGSVLKQSALPEGTPVGEVVAPDNEEKTWFRVAIGGIERVLTGDELVRVAPEE